jgi:hypothetical protein
MNINEKLIIDLIQTTYKDEELINRLKQALEDLVVCTAFTEELFQKDKGSHAAWIRAGILLDELRQRDLKLLRRARHLYTR